MKRSKKFAVSVKKSGGLTLIEILVALALLSVVFGLLILPFTKSFDLVRHARVVSSLESSIMLALRQIEQDVSRAMVVFFYAHCNLQDGDDLDNDGKFDEDPFNNIDDDNDGKVDEEGDDSTGKIDIVLIDQDFAIKGVPLVPQNKIIAYYGKLRDTRKPLSMEPKSLNPRVLYRGEIQPIDRDGDGMYGEDVVDGIDNDGDGRIDEDAPVKENAVTPLDGADLYSLRFNFDNATKSIIVDIGLRKIDPSVRAVRMPSGKIMPALESIRRQIRIPLDEWTEVIRYGG